MSALRPTRPPAATPLHQRDSTLTSTSRTHGLHPGSMTSCCVDRGVRRQDREDTGMVQGKITDGDVTELVRNTADAASAYIRGDIQRYLTLIKHGDNYTLMA